MKTNDREMQHGNENNNPPLDDTGQPITMSRKAARKKTGVTHPVTRAPFALNKTF